MGTVRVAGLLFSCAAALSVARADAPQTMQGAAIDHTGGPEVLTLHTLPVPAPAVKTPGL